MDLKHKTMTYKVAVSTTAPSIDPFIEWIDNRIMNSPRGLRADQHVAIARLDDNGTPVRTATHGTPDKETEEIINDLLYTTEENNNE